MRKHNNSLRWSVGLLAASIVAGCGRQTGSTVAEYNPDLLLSAACTRISGDLSRQALPGSIPRSVNADGSLHTVSASDWTSGFYPGLLWLLYEYCQESPIQDAARRWTALLESEKENAGTHDIGFMVYNSFGNGYRLMHDSTYRAVTIHAARTLTTRFHPRVGMIKSWDHSGWNYPVIVDNMMNLELLFAATRETGDSTFYDIAVMHADNTIRHHYRGDYSSYHVVDFDTLTGEVSEKRTHQGSADESAWARGQSWGLYGFTMAYRETKDPRFLKHAIGIADFLLKHPNLPGDGVPYWDYDAPAIPTEPRDASAAAIMASALLELAGYSDERAQQYVEAADQMLSSLSSPTYAAAADTPLPFLLTNSVGNNNVNSEVEVPIIYADYYYIEALLRRSKM